MQGNLHVRFLRNGTAATPSCYPVVLNEKASGKLRSEEENMRRNQNITSNETLNQLFLLFKRYVKNSEPDAESQMCLLWSIKTPPDVLEDTKQLEDLEAAFNIGITEDEAIEMYDMNLLEASKYIQEMINSQ